MADESGHETLRGSTILLEGYIRDQQYEGYDPFDALTSPVFKLPVLRTAKWPRLGFQQVLRRLPFNTRPFFGIPKGRNPVTFGLCLQGYTALAEALREDSHLYELQAEYCLDLVEQLQSRGYSGACWGYDFDWEGRYARIPAFVPTVVATGIISNALFRRYKATGDNRCFALCCSASDFVRKDLRKSWDARTFCYSYSPGDSQMVLNATMKGARLLAQVFSVTGERALAEEARMTVQFVMNHQRENGSWSYSVGDARTWTDNFHTAYILDCLDEYITTSGDEDFKANLRRGLAYYCNTFFEDGQIPKYYDDSCYPIDATAAAQSILTLCRFNLIGTAKRVALWMLENMQNHDGFFYYQRHRAYVNKQSYMRWSNAWMFCALASLLWSSQSENLSQSTR